MNCCGEEAEKEKSSEMEKAGKKEGKEGHGTDHGSHGGHGGCGMHGGGFMKWIWIGLLVYVIASYIR